MPSVVSKFIGGRLGERCRGEVPLWKVISLSHSHPLPENLAISGYPRRILNARLSTVSVYHVIFGAAVQAGGQPSPALRRRIEGALFAANGRSDARFMPTGGAGDTEFVEAEVIRRILLESGVPAEHIIVEPCGRNTLQSARLCDALLRAAGDVECVIPCTNPFHIPRCATLLRLHGWRVRLVPMPSDLRNVPGWKLLFYYVKELVALPCDVVLLLLRKPGRSA